MEDFCLVKRIYYHDTDCGGVVYYANYLKHLEEARTEYLLRKGIDLRKLSNKGIWFAVAKVEIKYKSPAHYQDTIRILTRIEKTKMSAILFLQQIFKDDVTIVEACTTLVCIGNDYKQVPLPEEIKKLLLARS
jgi:acyl-CoA thioester hydrolase